MITLNIEVPNGPTHTVKVKGAQDLTLADWKELTPIAIDPKVDPLDATYIMVERFTGIKQSDLDKMPMKGVGQIVDWIGGQLAEAQSGSDRFKKAIEEDTGYTPPATIKIAGKKYSVPQDIELDTVFGQWVDWQGWDAPQHEADISAEILAFMLVEEGQEYSGTPRDKVEAMMQCKMCIAFELAAFFFANSERFRSAMSQRKNSFRTSMTHIVSLALRLSPNDSEALISSLKQPS